MAHWRELTRDQLHPAERFDVVIVPIGATEQHGPHLPTGTDSEIAGAVAAAAARLAEQRGTRVAVLPTIEFGVSSHHLRYGGTISFRSDTQLAILRDVLDSLEIQGYRRALIINGHGGNTGVCLAAASEADARASLTVAFANWWDMAGIPNPGHAGSIETSVMLAIRGRGELAAPPKMADICDIPDIGVKYYAGWVWDLIGGVSDDPSSASEAYGAELFERAAGRLADSLEKLAQTSPPHGDSDT
jgi:creatinine amidohydrolase